MHAQPTQRQWVSMEGGGVRPTNKACEGTTESGIQPPQPVSCPMAAQRAIDNTSETRAHAQLAARRPQARRRNEGL